MERRDFLGLAAVTAVAAPTLAIAQRRGNPDASLTAQRSGSNACLPTDWSRVPTRTAPKVEILYKTTHGQPNGLAVTGNPEELWVLDQGVDHWVTLTRVKDGSVIREFQCDVVGPSGLVIDDDGVMWITSTHNALIVAVDSHTGKTIAKYFTPGAGRIYEKAGDPPPRVTKMPHAYPDAARGVGGPRNVVGNATGANLGPGQIALDAEEAPPGTGAHGVLSRGDELIYACPPTRQIVVLNKKTWEVQATWPTPGNRPHGMSWADPAHEYIWNVDSNLNAFYRFNARTGEVVEKIQLQDDPYTVSHGAKLLDGYMYFCDDVGWLCRFKM